MGNAINPELSKVRETPWDVWSVKRNGGGCVSRMT